MGFKTLQSQYDKIYSYFRTTCEPFDFLDWDGDVLEVWSKDSKVEVYLVKELEEVFSINE